MKLFPKKTSVVIALMIAASNAYADNATDYFLQNDLAASEAEGPDGLTEHYQEYIDNLLDKGYSPASIIMSAVGRGLTLADVTYLMSHSRPESAGNYVNTAEALLPSLPGWVCSSPSAMGHRYDTPIDVDKLSQTKSLADLAKLYFDENKRFVETPDWQNGVGHTNVDIDELIEHKQEEIKQHSELKSEPVDPWWFLSSANPSSDVISVGLYPEERRVIIEHRLVTLQAAKQRGVTEMPIMLMYNNINHIPTSDIERVPNEDFGGSQMKGDKIDYINNQDGEITATEVISRFEADGKRISPVRDWSTGDHHLMVRTDELATLFDIPKKEDIDPALWQEANKRLAQKTQKPLHISLLSDSDGERFLDSASLVAAAQEQSVKRLPVVFFYHGVDRQPCGMPSTCLPDVKAAAKAGSGRPDLFTSPDRKPPFKPPVIVPPVAGPISPS
jgi:hypothetical protein